MLIGAFKGRVLRHSMAASALETLALGGSAAVLSYLAGSVLGKLVSA